MGKLPRECIKGLYRRKEEGHSGGGGSREITKARENRGLIGRVKCFGVAEVRIMQGRGQELILER